MSRRVSSEETLACRRSMTEGLADLRPGARVVVACSGGADSLALVAAAVWVGGRAELSVNAVVVDHALQSNSHEVADAAASTCDLLGAPASVVRVDVGTEGGPEAAARDARYEALRRAAGESGAEAVLLGHTREDQAETVLLRLARGSGARSLGAMAPRTGLWRRPFLHLPRSTVRASAEDALASIGRQAWDDPHNEDPAFARVRVRQALAEIEQALGSGVIAGLARSADLLRDDADALEAIGDEAHRRIVSTSGSQISSDCSDLAGLAAAIRSRVIRSMIIEAGAPGEDVGIDHVRSVEALVSQWHGQGPVSLPGGVIAERSCGRLSVHSSSPRLEKQ